MLLPKIIGYTASGQPVYEIGGGDVQIGGRGTLGVAFETTVGTGVAPAAFIPIRNETLDQPEEKLYRMNIRGLADRQDPIQGFYRVEGGVTFEITTNSLLYFLYASRMDVAKSGAGPFTYTFTPSHVSQPTTGAAGNARKTLSVTVQRGDGNFRYAGCSVGQLEFTFESGLFLCTATILGRDVANVAAPTPTYTTEMPFGPEDNAVKIGANPAPTRTDIDTATVTINDNAAAVNRIAGTRAATLVHWGEREVTASFEHDFANMDEYDAFRAQTKHEIVLDATKGTESVTVRLKTVVRDSYIVQLSSLGDLVRASMNMHAFHDVANASPFEIIVVSDADIGGA